MSTDVADESTESGFVAMSYVLGARGEALTAGLSRPGLGAHALRSRLEHVEREARARHLAVELAKLVRALAARELSCR
ncbi:MAG TPA: hypothetical protein VF989_02710 [Polyangiaceae bacterium]|jgi:hypothetical protein